MAGCCLVNFRSAKPLDHPTGDKIQRNVRLAQVSFTLGLVDQAVLFLTYTRSLQFQEIPRYHRSVQTDSDEIARRNALSEEELRKKFESEESERLRVEDLEHRVKKAEEELKRQQEEFEERSEKKEPQGFGFIVV